VTQRRRLLYAAVMEARGTGPSAFAFVAGVLVVALAGFVSWVVFGRSQLADVAMVYLLGVVVVSTRFGYGPSLVAAVLSVVSFDFLFIPPYFSFEVANLRHIVTFAVMFVVAIVVSDLTKRIRDQADSARLREERTASLYALSQELGIAPSRADLLESAGRHIGGVFGARVAILLPGTAGILEPVLGDADAMARCASERAIVDWTWARGKRAGAGCPDHPSASALYAPLSASRGVAGVLAIFRSEANTPLDADELQLLATFAGLVGSALERTRLADEARDARVRVQTEQLRNALLSSVSHDLRTPLGVVTGATSALLDAHGPTDEPSRRRLLETAHGEALHLNRLVRNLLDMTRVEAGALTVRREVQSLEEVIGAALNRLEDRLEGRDVHVDVPADLPWISFDPVLIEQVLINLVENATKYSPPGSPLDIAARVSGGLVEAEVSDRGPGVAAGDADRIFDKFVRVSEREGGGFGLGLAICKGIVRAHGGRIWVEPRVGGGASFRFALPIDVGPAPAIAAAARSDVELR
jgi:two-component system sensor histidine kinase KdpD